MCIRDRDVAAIIQALRTILPADVLNLVEMYLTYVSSNHSPQLLLFGLFFSIYFPMRATNALMRSVRTAYHPVSYTHLPGRPEAGC